MRKRMVNTLLSIMDARKNVVILTADVGKSLLLSEIKEKYPERFFNVGIAEQNLIGIAAGLSIDGYIPIVCAFSKHLLLRGLEQIIDSLILNKCHCILIGNYSGLSSSKEGATHHIVNSLSILNSIPKINVFSPSNNDEIIKSLNTSLMNNSVNYIEISKNDLIKDYKYETINGISKYSTNGDILVLTTGFIINQILPELRNLDKITLCSIWKIKPFCEKDIEDLIIRYNKVIIIEENVKIGGLASVLKHYYPNKRFYQLGIFDEYSSSDEYEKLLEQNEIDAKHLDCLIEEVYQNE